MSADNWGACPGCAKKLAADKSALAERIQREYGVITKEEYTELLLKQSKLEKQGPSPTLREDWEIGIWDGVFEVTYSASCTQCRFSHKFSHSEVIAL